MRCTILSSCFSIILILFFIASCSNENPVDQREPTPITIDDISNTSYAMIAKTDNSLVLLGRLKFEQIENDQVLGNWNIETWGENSLFPTLPINEGAKFPSSNYIGTFSGFMRCDKVILKINLPSSNKYLGILVDGILNEKLIGQISLLPDKEFTGNFEAIRSH